MAYLVYEYPNGYGYISSRKADNPEYVLHDECNTIGEAKESLRQLINENMTNGKIQKR